ncbi:putative nucleotidyltransferase, ribonuclease H, partial [Tanacetum coccineum]
MLIEHEYVNCPLRFDDVLVHAKFTFLSFASIVDVILGRVWLASHRATIDCYDRTARTLVFSWVPRFYGSVMDTFWECPNIENLSVVREFADCFSDEPLDFPPVERLNLAFGVNSGAEPNLKWLQEVLFANLFEVRVWLQQVAFLGHIVSSEPDSFCPSRLSYITKGPPSPNYGDSKSVLWNETVIGSAPILDSSIRFRWFSDIQLMHRRKIYKSLNIFLTQRELNMRQRRWLEPLKVLTLQSVIPGRLMFTRYMVVIGEIEYRVLTSTKDQRSSMDDGLSCGLIGLLLCVPNDQALREKVMTEAHSSPFTIHPGSTKMYRDLKQYFWWNGMKQDVATFVSKCMTCQQVKIEHQRASGLLQPLEIPMWKWDEISMDFVTGLPTTQKRHDAIWVVVDRLTKDPKFTSRFWKGLQKAWGTRLKFSTAFHPQTDGQSERTIQTLEDMLRACALEWTGSWDEYLCLVEFAYNNSWHASIKAAPFELLYGRKCRAPICWDEVGERLIEGPELIEITNEKVAVAKEKLKEARSRQKSYADKHRRDLEFQVGDRVFLKVSPFRGVKRFGIKGKLSPRFIGPFEILERIGEVSYRLALPPQLSHVHDVFHVSLLRGYHYHPLHVASYPFDQIQPDMSLSEEPESILDRQERVMRNKVIPFVKILWKNHPEREATWETEESMRASYPHFFVRSRGSDFDIPVVFSLSIALLRNKIVREFCEVLIWIFLEAKLQLHFSILYRDTVCYDDIHSCLRLAFPPWRCVTREMVESFCNSYYILDEVHPTAPGRDKTITQFPEGKVGVYTRLFDYCGYRIPLTKFFVAVLKHFRIHIYQLSPFGAARVSHFEVLTRVLNLAPSVAIFRAFYTRIYSDGLFSFAKRSLSAPSCLSKPPDSIKNWADHFFWVDSKVFPISVPLYMGGVLEKDPAPHLTARQEQVVQVLSSTKLFRRYLECLLVLVGLSPYYPFDENTYPVFERPNKTDMGLLDYIRTADPRKVQVVEVQKGEEQVKLLDSIKHCFVSLDAPAVVQQEGGSGSGAGPEVSAPSAEENVVAEENIIPVGTYLDLMDPEGDLTVAEKGDAARKQPEKAKRKKLLKQSDTLPAKRLRVDHPSLASGTGGKTLASLRRTIPEGSLLLGPSSQADVHTQVTVR